MTRWIAVILAMAGCGFRHPHDVAPSPDAIAVDASTRSSFDSFVLRAADNPVLLADVTGAINGTDISLTVPFATPIDMLVPTFTVSAGASVRMGTTPQSSGSTPADFRAPVVYTVVSSDGTEADYRVTLSVAALPPLAFAPRVDVPVAGSSTNVAMGDIDGDGRVDLVVTTSVTNVSVLINTTTPGADPTFAPAVTVAAGAAQFQVYIADVNDDAKPDLVLAENAAKFVVVLQTTPMGASAPTFGPATTIPTQVQTNALAVGDINGDGLPDVVAVQREATADLLTIFLDTTAPAATVPSFTAGFDVPTCQAPVALALGDLDGDGRADLAAACFNSGRVSVLANRTPPGATEPSMLSHTDFATRSSPYFVAIGDFNADGKSDLVASEVNLASATMFQNITMPAGVPSFADGVELHTATNPRGIAIADLDHDGKPDLTVAGDTVTTLLDVSVPRSTVAFAPAADLGALSSLVAAGDIDGDASADLVFPAGNAGVAILLSR